MGLNVYCLKDGHVPMSKHRIVRGVGHGLDEALGLLLLLLALMIVCKFGA
jgi:hypothetical protein